MKLTVLILVTYGVILCQANWWDDATLEPNVPPPPPPEISTPSISVENSLSTEHSGDSTHIRDSDRIKEELVCCECVPFYLCPNGTINTDGEGILNLRIGPNPTLTTEAPPIVNVDICPGLDICCAPPDIDPSCYGREEVLYGPVLPPHTECECLVYKDCDPQFVVNDNNGLTTIELETGRLVSHSKCLHSLEVCCHTPEPPVIIAPQCECVAFHQCDSEGYIVTDGAGLLDLRFGAVPTNISDSLLCDHDPTLVCCFNRSDEINTPSFTTPYVSPTYPSVTTDHPEDDCTCVEDYLCSNDGFIIESGVGIINVRLLDNHKPHPTCPYDPNLSCCRHRNQTYVEETTIAYVPPVKKCGYRNTVGIGTRILGFREGQTQFGEFPWVVTLLNLRDVVGQQVPLFLGGASLIHPRVVLTAAHKVAKYTPEQLVIRVGEWDAASEKETYPHQDIYIEKVIIHPHYGSANLYHDVALLILKEEAQLDFHVSTICIAGTEDYSYIDTNSCVTNGWGVDTFETGEYQMIMKSVELPLVKNERCQNLLRKTRLSQHFLLHDSFVCAGGQEGVDTCNGDGGGPLACRRKDDPSRYMQVGITAWGIGCGGKDVPGVYVNVPSHKHWIQAQLDLFVGDSDISHGSASSGIVEGSEIPAVDESGLTKAEKKKLRKAERKRRNEAKRKRKQEERQRNRQENRNNNPRGNRRGNNSN